LRLTGKHLEAKGFHVELKTADEVTETDEGWPRFVFLMCERVEVLHRLRALEVSGVPHVNSPRAVHNTYRDRMIAVLDEANVPFIPSQIVGTSESPEPGAFPLWVKRGDVHNTQEGDVVRATTAAAVESALRGLAQRGIKRAVLQPHVEGDLIKFYGIGAGGGPHREPPWFRWFYHKDQKLSGNPMDQRALARLVRRAASALGLEVYGGDAIATATGELVLLDVNAWPSFALYRDEASAAIASYLALRFSGARR
jgi:hypothetical protein